MTRPLARPAAALLTAAVLALGAAGCGDDEPSDDPSTTAASDGAEPSATDTATAGGSDGGVAFVDTVDDPAATVDITADGFDPDNVVVAPGEVVRFTTSDDGTYSVVVAALGGYTVAPGNDEYFRFDQPGAYYVHEDAIGAELTVTAE